MNLKEYARLRGTNIKRLSEKSGIPASTLYAISSGDTDFDHTGISVFNAISSALGVTSDELYYALRFGTCEAEERNNTIDLTDSERELIEMYRSLSEDSRDAVMVVLITLAKGH